MKSKPSTLLALIAALLLALHAVGDEGGENGGGTGVWILPACAFVSSGSGSSGSGSSGPRLVISIDDPTSDVALCVSSQMGTATATYVDEVSGSTLSLIVEGRQVLVPASLLQALISGATSGGSIVITDSEQRGYLICVCVSTTGEIEFKVS